MVIVLMGVMGVTVMMGVKGGDGDDVGGGYQDIKKILDLKVDSAPSGLNW